MVSNSRKHGTPAVLLILCTTFSGCGTVPKDALRLGPETLKQRQIQTRAFATTDKRMTLRTVIATLQDLGFLVDTADEALGSVTATKLDGYTVRLTVTVRPRGATRLLVRASAQYNLRVIEDPKPFQNFFTALQKAMLLTAHAVY